MTLVYIGLFTEDPILASLIVDGLRGSETIYLSSLWYAPPRSIPELDILVWDLGDALGDVEAMMDWESETRVRILYLAEEPGQYTARYRVSESADEAGFLLRRNAAEGIGPAVMAVSAGLDVYPAGHPAINQVEESEADVESQLTERELSVLKAISSGAPSKSIALELGITERTVKYHLQSLYRKLDVQSRTEAALEGARRGIVPL